MSNVFNTKVVYEVHGLDVDGDVLVLGEFTYLKDAMRYKELMSDVYSVVFIQEFWVYDWE